MANTTRKKQTSKKIDSIRLNKFIADSGITSRRKAEELIKDGCVKVNGRVVTDLATKVVAGEDSVKVNNRLIRVESKKTYLMFNKPAGLLTSMDAEEERPTVASYFSKLKIKGRIFPVGRLDWDTEGLLLLTNDGDFAQEVIHPSKKIAKTYLAKINGVPTPGKLNKLMTGVTIPGGRVKAVHVEAIKRGDSNKYSWVKVVIVEGKNRQIRHMFAKIGYDVKKLQRVAIGQLTLGKLKKGDYVELDSSQLLKLFKVTSENFKPEQPQQNKTRTTKRATKAKPKSVKSKKDYFKQVRRKSR